MTRVVTAVLALQIGAAVPPIGVATVASDGQACVAMPGRALAPGAAVTLIDADEPQQVVTAIVDGPVTTCERIGRATIAGPYYRARAATARPAPGAVWIAFAGAFQTREIGPGVVALQMSDAHRDVQVRSCASHEGLHLTAWAGPPLRSPRLWHEYYYLGYDVEPSCGDADVRDREP